MPTKETGSLGPEHVKLRRDKKAKQNTIHTLLATLGVLSALMLGISLSILNPETGPLANFKVLLVTCSAGLVAYSVNVYAISRGTALTAIGYKLSGIASVVGMLLVGAGMFIGAYSGLVYKAVEERILQANGSALVLFVSETNALVSQSSRAIPALHLIADDLNRYASCERKSSCLSRVGAGGYGPVAAETRKVAHRASSVARAFDTGEGERHQQLSTLNRLAKRYQEILAETEKTIKQRRPALLAVHAEIDQAALALSETLPLSLLTSFAGELQGGSAIPGQPGGNQRLNAILHQHGETLSDILSRVEDDGINPPTFPSPPSMIDSLKFISEFAAFAAVIFIAELGLPITIWVFTYLRLCWEIERRTERQTPNDSNDEFGGLIDLPPLPSYENKGTPPTKRSRPGRPTRASK